MRLRSAVIRGFFAQVHIVANEMMSSNPDFDLSRFLPYQLAVLASRTSRNLSQTYQDSFGLSIPEWRVIAHLSQEGHVSVREIHERVDMDKSKVTRASQRLEMAGLIKKETNPSDRRLVTLSLTAKGRNTMAKIAPLADEFAQDLLSVLEPLERDVFQSVVEKLLTESAGSKTNEDGRTND